MKINIYVGNLAFSMKDDDLRTLFESYGEVETAKIISDRATGRSKGFGFVEMTNREDGEKAINALNGKDVQGRGIKVNEARPRQDKNDSRDFRESRGGGQGGKGKKFY
jgi:RNA recognition motif-containing protein